MSVMVLSQLGRRGLTMTSEATELAWNLVNISPVIRIRGTKNCQTVVNPIFKIGVSQ